MEQQQQQPLSNEILDVLKQVLRNYSSNSITDYKLYDVALKTCDQLCQFHPKQLGSLEQQQDDDEEDSSSVLMTLQEAAQTSQCIVKNLMKGDSNNQRQQHQQHHQLAQRVVSLFEQAKKASDAVHSRPDLMVSSKEDQYRQSLRPLCFQFCNHLKSHFFAKKTVGSRTNVKRLFAELSTYASALPVEYGSSILVRAVEDQSHLLRALIFGPEDTPCANGCFVFDICLENYPYQPPKVQFLTTGGGKYRFNPNLYKDGKDCLSLLGT